MSWPDRIVITAAAIVVGFLYALFWNGAEGQWLEVSVRGEVVAKLDLQQEQDFVVKGLLGESHIHIADGRAAFVDSPCPSKLCIRTGHIHHAGETAVCLPNGISLQVVADEAVFDAVNF